jgi:hypothetical protein
MGVVLRPRVMRFERCLACGAIIWRCRLQRGGTISIDPRPVSGGLYIVVSRGRLRDDLAEPQLPRYTLHIAVCSVTRQRSEKKHLRRVLEWEVANAVAEGRRPQPPRQLSLLPPDQRPRRRWKEGWIDLTVGYHRGPPEHPWDGVVVVDLIEPPEPPRPN